ncbi:hypothetical protein F7U66_01295 [Vibrio parahaemolyticus]|nr:hypothetical protein [Vibrio parahaemolyticus]
MKAFIGITKVVLGGVQNTRYSVPEDMSSHEKLLIANAVSSYSFLLEPGEYTYGEFAQLILASGDEPNEETEKLVKILKLTQ